ncbi:hypothetical protein EZV73_19740 [Acidaminobacter sp. JC074]|uniref:B3/B4 domain-containing protein n=1 Tax=Acidaminobacter sp. JC074 TaxID=2530199 RepID=UPI001F106B61|nr:phenylalanine--tRNA ligase beta subunit-related protein [Acidaminobacter sp. JC074]MCH4889826.1 hypothetical protein [Acidaminobacter sp. JC074]
MYIEVDEKIFELFPETQIGIVKLHYQPGQAKDTESLLMEYENLARQIHTSPLLEIGELSQWRTTYKTLNVKKGVRVSVESLLKRVIKDKKLPNINPLVDIYNCVSLKYALPLGGEDLSAVKGNIHLTLADGNESFTTIGSDINEPPEKDEIVYKDDLGCLCRRWNWREADRTKLTDQTQDAIIVFEVLSKAYRPILIKAMSHFEELAKSYLNASTRAKILEVHDRRMMLDD